MSKKMRYGPRFSNGTLAPTPSGRNIIRHERSVPLWLMEYRKTPAGKFKMQLMQSKKGNKRKVTLAPLPWKDEV